MADTIQGERWVHTSGCGHATLPTEEMYPRIGGLVGFHPMIELPLTFFTRITGGMGVHQFVVAKILAERGVKPYIHPSHNVAGDGREGERLGEALAGYRRRMAGV